MQFAIKLEASSARIGIDGISVVWATCKDQNNNSIDCPSITWFISDPTIAKLEPNPATVSCFITGNYTGQVNVIANSGSIYSDPITITVEGPTLQFIDILPKDVDIGIGKTSFIAKCRDQYNGYMECPSLSWNSSNTSVGTIDQNGEFTGLSEGTTKITAFSQDKTSNITNVTVTPARFTEFMIFGSLAVGMVFLIIRQQD